MPEYIYIEVEDSENCDYMPMQVYEPQAEPSPIARVRLEEPDRPHGIYDVTGWSDEHGGSPTPALYAPISDSGQARAHLIYGGDYGVRLKPAEIDEAWDIASPNQFGEPYLILLDDAAIQPDGQR